MALTVRTTDPVARANPQEATNAATAPARASAPPTIACVQPLASVWPTSAPAAYALAAIAAAKPAAGQAMLPLTVRYPSKRYPLPRTVLIRRGADGSGSIF